MTIENSIGPNTALSNTEGVDPLVAEEIAHGDGEGGQASNVINKPHACEVPAHDPRSTPVAAPAEGDVLESQPENAQARVLILSPTCPRQLSSTNTKWIISHSEIGVMGALKLLDVNAPTHQDSALQRREPKQLCGRQDRRRHRVARLATRESC